MPCARPGGGAGAPIPRVFQQPALQIFLLSMVILLIGGGVALLWENQQVYQKTQAADVSVVGSPTLSATTIDTIFAHVGSPMVGTGKTVEQASRQTNVDDAFALAVWWTETNDGAAGVGLADRNPGSVRGSVGYPSAFDGYTIYPSYTVAIIYWFNMLRNGYVNHGLSTVYAIARPYVGTGSYPLWAGKVIALMYNYRGIAPPPPASVPQPKPTINPAVVAASNARSRKLAAWLQYLSAHNYSAPPYVSGRIQEKFTSSTGTQPLNTPPALPRAAELSVVLFGLLTALAIALYSLKMPAVRVQRARVSMAVATGRGQAIARGQGEQVAQSGNGEPTTDDLPVLPMPVTGMLSLPARSRITDALPRRVVLLPVHPVPENPVAMGAGSGLLSRYRQNNNNTSI
ncbi:MAG: hypothetical protein NVSMB27_31130 [Ktedonobacteraceae bacterium]